MAAPADAEKDPGSHFAHDAEPTEIEAGAPEYLPAPQAMQVEAPTSGKFGKYLPACRVREPSQTFLLFGGADKSDVQAFRV